jgi:hypothetical protein
LPGPADSAALGGMGAKYLPSIKDQKLNQRFQQKVNPLKKFNKAGGRPAKKSRKK